MKVDQRHPANGDERISVSLVGGRRVFRTIKVKSVRQRTGRGPYAGGVVGGQEVASISTEGRQSGWLQHTQLAKLG